MHDLAGGRPTKREGQHGVAPVHHVEDRLLVDGLRSGLGNRAFASAVTAHLQRQLAGVAGAEAGETAGEAEELQDLAPDQAQQDLVGLRHRDGLDFGTTGKRPQVTTLQGLVNTFTGAGLATDGMWGRLTNDAVHQAQLLAGLPTGDVIDQALAALLGGGAPPPTQVRPSAAMIVGLQQGDGQDPNRLHLQNRVRLVQTKLGERGFPVHPDGLWGNATDLALRAFQTSEGLTPGSPIDTATAEALIGPAQTTSIDPGSATALFGQIRIENRPFGSYTIIPDGTSPVDFPQLLFMPEVVTETQFAEIQGMWDSLVAGDGNIQVGEIEPRGRRVAGFRDQMLRLLGTLMSRQAGRQVIRDIRALGRLLLIAPAHPLDAPAGQPTGGPVTRRDIGRGLAPPIGNGLASDSTIFMPPDLTDTSFVAFDQAGNPIQVPVFTILGHELAHALHNAQGQNRAGETPSHPSFDNLEEENAITLENQLRTEHGLVGQRFGHRSRRRRPTDFAGP